MTKIETYPRFLWLLKAAWIKIWMPGKQGPRFVVETTQNIDHGSITVRLEFAPDLDATITHEPKTLRVVK